MSHLHRTALLACCAALLSMLIGCSIKEPVLPSWEALFRLPFAPGDFVIGEKIVNDSTIVVESGSADSLLLVTLADSIDIDEISATDLSVDPGEAHQSLHLDTLVIDTLEILISPDLALRTLLPYLEPLIGQTVTVPDTTVSGPPAVLSASRFRRVHFLSGVIRLKIVNRLPFPLGPNGTSSGVRVTVVNDSLNEVFISLNFPNVIASGDSAQQEFNIGERWLYSPLRLEYEVPVAQPTTITITQQLLDNAGISATLGLFNIRSDEAVAILRPQTYQGRLQIGYDGETRLKRAVIDRGFITVDLINHFDLSSLVRFTLPTVRDAQGAAFTDSLVLPERGSSHLDLDLAGFQILNPNNPDAFIDSIEVQISARTRAAGDIVNIRSTDSVSVQIQSDTLFLRSIAGFLGADTLQIDPTLIENIADYGDFTAGLQLSAATLNLRIFSEVMIDNLTADLNITGIHRDEGGQATDSATIVLTDQPFNGGRPGEAGVTELNFSGPEIVTLLNILPTDLRFSGRVRVSGNAEVAVGDRIYGHYRFETPIRARIISPATFDGPVNIISRADVDSLLRDAADENVLSANLVFQVTNHLPLNGSVRFIITADEADSNIYDPQFDSLLVIRRDIAVPAAEVDPLSGLVINSRENQVTLPLNRREIRLFKDPPLRYGYQVLVDPTDGVVTLRYSDFLRIIGSARLNTLVK